MDAILSSLVWALGFFWLMGVLVLAGVAGLLWAMRQRFRRAYPQFAFTFPGRDIPLRTLAPLLVRRLPALAPVIFFGPFLALAAAAIILPFLLLFFGTLAIMTLRARFLGVPSAGVFTYTQVFPEPGPKRNDRLPPRGEVIDV